MAEAIFLADSAHAKFVYDIDPAGFPSRSLLALSADAHGWALRHGARQVVAPYEVADYRQSVETDHAANLRLSREWLAELGLAVIIEGINLAEFDGLNQFLLFQQAGYIARTAAAMIAALPAGIDLRVPVGAVPLAADFYLDSDMAASIVLHVAESMGRRIEPLSMARRPLRFAICTDRRPFFNDRLLASVFPRRQAGAGGRRIGFVPSVVHRIEDYYGTLSRLSGDDVMIFASRWSDRPAGPHLDGAVAGESWLASASGMLEQYRQAFWQRIGRSSLPRFLCDNPYLRYQFDYILTGRWLSYARYIYGAAHFVRDNPLDLLIACDHWVAEGAILADLYRRAGTRIAIATHSLHACDVPYVSWDPKDSAIVRSGFAARQALETGGLSAAYNIAGGRAAGPRAPAEPRSRRVLFIANAVEAPQPLVDMRVYLAAIAALADIPLHLRGRVDLAVRLKPGGFSEYWEVHSQLCGLDPGSVLPTDGVGLEEHVAQADCVIGIGIPTSAYLEVLAQGKPLIHVDTGPCFPTSANVFPHEIEGCVVGPDRLWPEIEALLFDEAARETRLARQRACFERDQAPSFPGAEDPIGAAIDAILAAPP